jgi:membrane protein DedA with SNARE-associated domain
VNFLDPFFGSLETIPDHWLYFFLGLSAFVENLFPPIPGDTITVFGAFLVGTGRLAFSGVYLCTTAGSVSGFLVLFWAGGLLGKRFFMEKDLWFFKAKHIVRGEEWYRKYGYFLILLNRFLPGVRSVISLVGGISRLQVRVVAFLALVSAAIWNLIWIVVGYTLGDNWVLVQASISYLMGRYNYIMLLLLSATAAAGLIWLLLKKFR